MRRDSADPCIGYANRWQHRDCEEMAWVSQTWALGSISRRRQQRTLKPSEKQLDWPPFGDIYLDSFRYRNLWISRTTVCCISIAQELVGTVAVFKLLPDASRHASEAPSEIGIHWTPPTAYSKT